MDWVSFDEIKKTVSLQMVIDHYGIALRRVGPDTLRGKCPLPTHSSETSRESFTATLSKGVGGAWACQSQSCIKARGRVGGNALDLVAAMERCSVRDAAMKLQTWFLVTAAAEPRRLAGNGPQRESSVREKQRAEGSRQSNGEREASECNKPLAFELQKIDHAHRYLKDRGIAEETARKFGVGVFSGKGSMHGRCVIPIHNAKGELIAYAGRAIDGSEPRYKFPPGFYKSLELYNLHRINPIQETVGVVEGFFDCITVCQAGFPCVALMGSTMSAAQEEMLIRHFTGLCFLFDGDEAGEQAAVDCLARLGRRMWVRAYELPAGKQPDMLSVEEIQALLGK